MRVTEREKQVLAFFMAYEEENGRAPSLQEVANFLGLSKQRVGQFVKRLEKKGLMARKPGVDRVWKVML